MKGAAFTNAASDKANNNPTNDPTQTIPGSWRSSVVHCFSSFRFILILAFEFASF